MKSIFFFLMVFVLSGCELYDAPGVTPTITLPQPNQTPEATAVAGAGRLVWVADLPEEGEMPGEYGGIVIQSGVLLWVRTSTALAQFKAPDEWVVAAEAPAGENIIGMDDLGRAYAASPEGETISVWQGGAWTTYGQAQGWEPIQAEYVFRQAVPVQTLFTESGGATWLVSAQDVRRLDWERDAWRVFPAAEMGMQLPVPGDSYPEFRILLDPENGSLWVGECNWGGPGPFGGAGVRHFVDGAWQGADWPVKDGCVTDLAIAEDGALWAGLQPSVWRFDPAGQSWSSLGAPEPPDGSRPGYATQIAPDAEGGAWIRYAFCGGASCGFPEVTAKLQGGRWLVVSGLEDEMPAYLIPWPGGKAYQWNGSRLVRLSASGMEAVTELFVADWAAPYWVIRREGGGLSLWIEKP